MVQEVSPQELFQPIRSVHKSLRLSAIAPPTTDDIFYVVCYANPKKNKLQTGFVFWDDILQAFEEGLHVRDGAKMVPFLRGPDLKILEPRRIAASPNTVLDIVVGGPLVDTEVTSPMSTPEKPEFVPMRAKKEKEINDKDTAATSAVRYPLTYVPPATSMESQFDKLAVAPSAGVLQAWPSVPSPANRSSQAVYRFDGITGAHSLGPQEYSGASNLGQFPRPQEYPGASNRGQLPRPQEHPTTPGRDVTNAIISAHQGDKVAQAALGDMYKEGHGVYQDYLTAMDWYLKAANQGHSDAQYKIGAMYSTGLGVSQDYSQAMAWFLKAADQGHAGAQYNVGLHYDVGRGVGRDYLTAEEWYQKAADLGNSDAKKMLDDMSKKDLHVI
ncbi:hypothetical protein BGZ96_008750 [Linnemannia gamsii]|uniref:HCP-like protein n=1 Tax=Linnemannia gamsii TaxID=64522 RepID=A0ABQ7KDP0_9FUNG|nr:hypothetical protein BGZ96_008750 [Linnemannia gamsii]